MRPRWVIFVPLLAAFSVQPPGAEPRSGTATFTDLTGAGACSMLGEPPDNLHVGLSSAEFGTADVCGGYLDVTGPNGTVRVQITDHCPRCSEGLIDVSRTAFAAIGDVDAGRVPVTYSLVRNPPLALPISVRVESGSSRDWMQIQALDHGNPIASFEIRTGTGWRQLTHTTDNYWTAADPGPGEGPHTVRITDIFGQSVTIGGIALAPGAVQQTGARLYDSGAAVPPPAGTGQAPPPTSARSGSPGSTPPSSVGSGSPPATPAPGQQVIEAPGSDERSGDADDEASPPGSGTGPPDGEGVFALFVLLGAVALVAKLVSNRRHRSRHLHLR